MSAQLAVISAVIVFLASLSLTAWFRSFALTHKILDVPNERSSHVTATPRGGGVAIVLTTLTTCLVAGLSGSLAWPNVWSLCGSGALVALTGLVDDRRPLPARVRLLGHFISAAWALICIGGLPPVVPSNVFSGPHWLENVVGAVYLVWLLNLTNFMDGIDGIAGVESITVCLGSVGLYAVAVPGEALWLPPVILAAASFGFLVWNWPPARIFMGDVGSGFLGMLFGVLSLQAGWVSPALFWGWVILLGVFVVDATVTLLRRLARGDRAYEAHRSHAYQHAASKLRAHRPVTVAVAAINLLWLFPLALLVVRGAMGVDVGLLVAYAPLVAGALWLRAGEASPG